ncbi:MAG: AAA family ATPase, partial [Methanobrevibacter sp.]|nr:AAA family ATPase [Candidatus Methanoflexus mossambicus]
MKRLPKGMADFINIRENDYIYVDKTEYIYNMVAPGEKYFLSRPRRFGKSLLISTLEQLFEGNKKLFEDLYIYDKWDWNETYPVIHLDFGSRGRDSPEILTESLMYFLDKTAKKYGVEIDGINILSDKFETLIEEIAKKTNKKLVILVDEYDKAIIDNLSNLDVAEANRKILSEFYEVMKSMEKYIHFIFITGVSKFSKTSIFSKLNNLTDLTLDPEYSALCGYTQVDLEYHFYEHIQILANRLNYTYEKAMELIKLWYNGYSWDGETKVYNPYSTLILLSQKYFSNNWFTTGTPTFLIDLLKENNDLEPIIKPIKVGKKAFEEFEPLEIKQLPLLFQTGYLTITNIEFDEMGDAKYTLELPNFEVEKSLLDYLLDVYANIDYINVKETVKTV